MNQASQVKLFLFILSCLAFSPPILSKSVKFNIAFDEFVLKNSYSLKSQIKNKSGLGFQSLSNQLSKLACDTDILDLDKLLENLNPYYFYRELTKSIKACNPSFNNKTDSDNIDLSKLLNGKEVYLITAGETLNSPMSYFGHSLLLFLDKNDFYFSPVISVLAPTSGQSILSQTVKGGFSKIPAEVSAMPLHQVISFYSNQESRSLRFIKLSNTVFKKDKLIDYFIQKIDSKLTYNFFTKNCSTYLYEALNYSCNCIKDDKFIVSPSFLAKEVQKQGGTNTFELPSLFKKFNTVYQSLKNDEKETVQSLIFNGNANNQNKKLGSVAALGSQLSFETYDSAYPSYVELKEKYSDDLFLIEELPEFSKYEGPLLDKLNLSSVKFSFNKLNKLMTFSLVDYNDLEQRNKKFTSSSISAGVLEIVKNENSTKVNSITLIDISTIRPIDFLSQKSSWHFKIKSLRDKRDKLSTFFSFGMGGAASILGMNFYIIPTIDISSSTKTVVYSGMKYKNNLFSLDYKNIDFNKHKLSIHYRKDSNLGYEYKIEHSNKKEVSHTLSLAYYF